MTEQEKAWERIVNDLKQHGALEDDPPDGYGCALAAVIASCSAFAAAALLLIGYWLGSR